MVSHLGRQGVNDQEEAYERLGRCKCLLLECVVVTWIFALNYSLSVCTCYFPIIHLTKEEIHKEKNIP